MSKTRLKIAFLKSHPDLPGTNELRFVVVMYELLQVIPNIPFSLLAVRCPDLHQIQNGYYQNHVNNTAYLATVTLICHLNYYFSDIREPYRQITCLHTGQWSTPSPACTGMHMMTSSNGNIFRVTGHLCGEFTGPRWIPHTKASDAELWCFLWSASE